MPVTTALTHRGSAIIGAAADSQNGAWGLSRQDESAFKIIKPTKMVVSDRPKSLVVARSLIVDL